MQEYDETDDEIDDFEVKADPTVKLYSMTFQFHLQHDPCQLEHQLMAMNISVVSKMLHTMHPLLQTIRNKNSLQLMMKYNST